VARCDGGDDMGEMTARSKPLLLASFALADRQDAAHAVALATRHGSVGATVAAFVTALIAVIVGSIAGFFSLWMHCHVFVIAVAVSRDEHPSGQPLIADSSAP